MKHNNPCGTAEQATLVEAYRQALACDPVSAFGGVLAFNRPLDAQAAAEVAKLFVECIAAPGYDAGAREALAGKKNLRLHRSRPPKRQDGRRCAGSSSASPAACSCRKATTARWPNPI